MKKWTNSRHYPAKIYFLNVNNIRISKYFGLYSKRTIKTPKLSDVFNC